MKIALLAGETSGDQYGALLADYLRNFQPDLTLIGLGGRKMAGARVRFLAEIPLGTIGWTDVFRKLPGYYQAYQHICREILREKPDLIVFLDNPGFNLQLAKTLGKKFPCYYYIPPKVWAHGQNRLRIMKEYIQAVIAIFSFEVSYFQKEGINCYWFGHPIVDIIDWQVETKQLEEKYLGEREKSLLGILPGSRKQEIEYLLPELLPLAKEIQFREKLEIVFSAVDEESHLLQERIMKQKKIHFPIWQGSSYALMKRSRVLLAACGTVNLELALLGKPFLVLYKTSLLNYLIARSVVKLKFASPVNICLGKRVVPEHLQFIDRELVTGQVQELLRKGRLYQQEKEGFLELEKLFPRENVSRKVAEFLLQHARK